ncbi:dolichyl-diphosphooligosaccharide--protein glycosyltransferase 48 kDa subunit isoform X2 [Hyalella azteca]|nr:dolichyl-diphosphooligosaccharide--protein glycosyltransferase 48 kDa subunit isoform X2 [Hyalella azteca]XP_018025716.1 dolichyl-diphosphooligosaccharide--protein glycosyltransferase 48 kDa subunit isoform X2 [Hyalella azteca]
MWLSSLFLVTLVGCASATKTLVLVDTLATRETHSIFLKALTDRGHDLTIKSADEPSLQLARYGEYLYDNLILFAPGVEEFGGALSVEAIIEFVDEGGNLIVAGSTDAADLIRELSTEVGVEMDEEDAAVIDHLNYDTRADDGQHTLVTAPVSGLLQSSLVVGQKPSAPLLYRGTGLITDPENPLILPVLKASSTAYCHNPTEPITEYPHATGESVVLLAALQARNNARVLVSGSLEFFSDAFISAAVTTADGSFYPTSGNGGVVEAVTKWALKEAGVIRVVDVTHNKVGENSPPSEYTIKDDLEYHITVELLEDGKWKPFKTNDLQVEFVRIDPFVRTSLKPSDSGRFSVRFKVPDVYGVYQFKVEYNRVGYTRLYHSTQVAVRPFLHTQYERFIWCAYPYYASAASMMLGVFLFSFVFLHHKDPAPREKSD